MLNIANDILNYPRHSFKMSSHINQHMSLTLKSETTSDPANMILRPNRVSMMVHRLLRWLDVETSLGQSIMLAGEW